MRATLRTRSRARAESPSRAIAVSSQPLAGRIERAMAVEARSFEAFQLRLSPAYDPLPDPGGLLLEVSPSEVIPRMGAKPTPLWPR